jgi:hypothetical protein
LKTFQDNTTFKRILQSYHNIAEKGGWDPIVLPEKSNHYNPEILLM